MCVCVRARARVVLSCWGATFKVAAELQQLKGCVVRVCTVDMGAGCGCGRRYYTSAQPYSWREHLWHTTVCMHPLWAQLNPGQALVCVATRIPPMHSATYKHPL